MVESVSTTKLRGKALHIGSSRTLLLAAMLVCAALIAVEAAPASKPPPKPVASKPPPKPVASKPPPKPVASKPPPKPVASKPPPKPVASKPPPKPVASKPPPKPVASKPPPKPVASKPPPNTPSIPPYHVDPIFCRPCIDIYGYVGYGSQNVDFSESTCQNVTEVMAANLTSALTAANATVLSIEPDCSSGALIRLCGVYYTFTPLMDEDAGSNLAQGWLSYLISSGLLKGTCGSKPAGTLMSLSANIENSGMSWACGSGSASASWPCS